MDRRIRWMLAALVLMMLASWGSRRAPVPPAPTASAPAPVRRTIAAPAPALPADDAGAGDLAAEDPREALLADGRSSALCRVEPALPDATGHLVVGDPGEPPYDGRQIEVQSGYVTLPRVEGDGEGVLAIEGYGPVAVRWQGGSESAPARCEPDPVALRAGEAWVTGRVTAADGAPAGEVFVEGCGNQARTDASGGYAMAVTPGPCTVNAFRRDGLLIGKAHAAAVEPVAGREVVADFVLPDERAAGLGIVVQNEEHGVRILDVLPGTAAAEAELAAGDLVLEVDGTLTAGIELQDFVDLVVGPVGTEVEVHVLRADRADRLRLDRRELRGG